MDMLLDFVSGPWFITLWLALMLPSLLVLILDLHYRNSHLMPLMKLVWGLSVAYSGPIGLGIYWVAGRKEISNDSDWRRAFRSVAHCYSGCGLGEITGVAIAVGLLQAGNTVTAAVTFALAYIFGFGLTVGPEIQGGTDFRQAIADAFKAETPSIAVMEIVAIGVDLSLAGSAGMGEWVFWSSLVISLSCGLFAAWPVNYWLIRKGVKEGMMDPRMTDHGSGDENEGCEGHGQHAH
ncbi:DUF4396 domain-containing protein [Pseudooceanicola algae]|uniref:Uncharacterized protein n=1 Tax=Pseudooceanicola algae TaxID=1537215 RepID=A0A418SCD4_9RHOB|nr:DUF4396 domain-containing protein [Pseudooceanicola algae]QPM89964.1 hypothetical protein PSAL_011950 [Pseudooceanicola algae]